MRALLDLPDGVRISARPDNNLNAMLVAGEIDAVISARPPAGFHADGPIRRMFADSQHEELAYFQRTSIFPIMHLIVVRRDAYERDDGSCAASSMHSSRPKAWPLPNSTTKPHRRCPRPGARPSPQARTTCFSRWRPLALRNRAKPRDPRCFSAVLCPTGGHQPSSAGRRSLLRGTEVPGAYLAPRRPATCRRRSPLPSGYHFLWPVARRQGTNQNSSRSTR